MIGMTEWTAGDSGSCSNSGRGLLYRIDVVRQNLASIDLFEPYRPHSRYLLLYQATYK